MGIDPSCCRLSSRESASLIEDNKNKCFIYLYQFAYMKSVEVQLSITHASS